MAAGGFNDVEAAVEGYDSDMEARVRDAILEDLLNHADLHGDFSDDDLEVPDLYDSDYELNRDFPEILLPRVRAPRTGPESPSGGYDCQFVADLPDPLQCLICTVAAKDPQQLDCCGKIFCKSCLSHLKLSANKSCPNCRNKKWKSFPDKKSDRDIKSLKVKCSNLSVSGCKWIGELRELEEHLSKCAGELHPCRYASIGCTVKKFKLDLPSHETECTSHHLKLSMEKTTLLEEEVKRLRSLLEVRVPPVTFKFPNFVEESKVIMNSEKKTWESPPFYSHRYGYKFCLCLQFEPGPEVSATAQICLMKGENDGDLEWPFRGTVKFEALNQELDSDHRLGVARFMEMRESLKNSRVPANLDRNATGWSVPKFIFSGSPGYHEFISNGTLYIRINSVQVSDRNKYWLVENLAP